MRRLDALRTNPAIDQDWLAQGRWEIQKAWMAINRAIFKPDRVKLDDEA